MFSAFITEPKLELEPENKPGFGKLPIVSGYWKNYMYKCTIVSENVLSGYMYQLAVLTIRKLTANISGECLMLDTRTKSLISAWVVMDLFCSGALFSSYSMIDKEHILPPGLRECTSTVYT